MAVFTERELQLLGRKGWFHHEWGWTKYRSGLPVAYGGDETWQRDLAAVEADIREIKCNDQGG